MPVIFEPGEWKGVPTKGTMTPRVLVGWMPGDWEVLYWQVKNKSAAVQVHVREDWTLGKKIFFSSAEEAFSWLDHPIEPNLDEIKEALEKCKWHEPSRGRIQVWLNFRRV